MYNNGILGGGAGAGGVLAGGATAAGGLGALPFTGLSLIWVVVAMFALLMAASALWRITPRRQA